jgi:hypothetical protein
MVNDAWDTRLSEKAFKNVYERLQNVLMMIDDDKGGNAKVEENRGKNFRKLEMPDASDESDNEDWFCWLLNAVFAVMVLWRESEKEEKEELCDVSTNAVRVHVLHAYIRDDIWNRRRQNIKQSSASTRTSINLLGGGNGNCAFIH